MDYLYKFNNGLTIVKDDVPVTDENMKHYSDDWESLLPFKVPGKMRKTKQLLNYQDALKILNTISFGTLSFFEEIPYSIALDHVYKDGKLYFHTAKKGYKLRGLNKQASYLVIEDLGINEEKRTHNSRSVYVLGILKETEDVEVKKEVLTTLVHDLCPNDHVIISNDMTKNVEVLELDIQYMIGKEHIR